jgi:hypothetical protein
MFERHFNLRRRDGTVAAFPPLPPQAKIFEPREPGLALQSPRSRGPRPPRHDASRVELMGHKMRKMLSFGIAAALTIVVVAAWGAAGPRFRTHAEITTVGIDPIALMQRTTDLQLQQYDPF